MLCSKVIILIYYRIVIVKLFSWYIIVLILIFVSLFFVFIVSVSECFVVFKFMKWKLNL